MQEQDVHEAEVSGKAEGGDEPPAWWTSVVSEKPFNFGFAAAGGFMLRDRAVGAKREERFRDWLEGVIKAGLSKWGGRL